MTEQVEKPTGRTEKSTDKMVAAMVTHLEIPTLVTKQEETAALFAETFGWAISYDIMPNYGMSTNTQDKVSIGLPLVEENAQPVGNLYIHVDDINETLEIAKDHGCKVVSEKNLISADIGFGATFEDLSGNKIGLFAPE